MWFLKCFVFITCCLSVFSIEIIENVMQEDEIDQSLLENIVVYGISSELRSHNRYINATCANDLTNLLRSINKQDMWAIKGSIRLIISILLDWIFFLLNYTGQ